MLCIINGLPHAIRLPSLEPQLALRMFAGEDQSSPPFHTHLLPGMVLGGLCTMELRVVPILCHRDFANAKNYLVLLKTMCQ